MLDFQHITNHESSLRFNDDTALQTIGEYDVLCGRHKAAFNNAGNKRFRVTVSLSLDCFMQATSRKEKNTVIKSILKIIQGNGGKFLEFKKNRGLIELTTKKAHMKVGHALRDMALASRTTSVKKEVETDRQEVTQVQVSQAAVPTAPSSAPVFVDPLDIFDCISTEDIVPEPAMMEDAQSDMLQWLVGESDCILGTEEPAISTATLEEGAYTGGRSSIVIDDDLIQWLVGESNDATFDEFKFV